LSFDGLLDALLVFFQGITIAHDPGTSRHNKGSLLKALVRRIEFLFEKGGRISEIILARFRHIAA
jgi:hypothetical protein